MKTSSAALLWIAVLLAVLCTLATLVSLFYISYGYSTLPTPMEMRESVVNLQKSGVLPLHAPDGSVLRPDSIRSFTYAAGMRIHLSPIGPLIFTLAPLCWLFVYWKDRPALTLRDGRIASLTILTCLLIFLVSLAWLGAYSWAEAHAR